MELIASVLKTDMAHKHAYSSFAKRNINMYLLNIDL